MKSDIPKYFTRRTVLGFLKFFLPFALWLFLFYPIVLGRTTIAGDTSGFYALTKFFIDNLQAGTFALWDPFVFCGQPLLIDFLIFGATNPIWLIMLLWQCWGVSIYLSFVWTLIIYFFIGTIGFYFLAKALLNDPKPAYIAFLSFLFSWMGMYIFTSANSLFISVPMIWFFYFLIRFWQTWEKRFFVGIAFTLIIISSCYLPFYWLTTFVLVSIFYLALYPTRLKSDLGSLSFFLRRQSRLVLFCVMAIGLTLVTSFKGYQMVKTGDVLALDRKILVREDARRGGFNVAYEKVANLCASAQTVAKGLFFNLDAITSHVGEKYFSIFVYCVLFLSFLNRVTRQAVFLFLLTVVLFFVTLGDQTPLCKIFFLCFPFFRLIHQVTFFYAVIGPLFVLFVASQFTLLIREKTGLPRKGRLAAVVGAHAIIWFFLRTQPMLLSTHVAVLASAIFFAIAILDHPRAKGLQAFFLILAIVIQPAQVMWQFHGDLGQMDQLKELTAKNSAYASTRPHFSFVRPDLADDWDLYDAQLSRIQMKDAPGFLSSVFGYPSRGTYSLVKNFSLPTVWSYARHKFYLYDHVKIVPDEEASLHEMKEILSGPANLAIVLGQERSLDDLRASDLRREGPGISGRALAIVEPSEDFEVLDFGVNTIRIRTHFLKEKFLVYTDNFHAGWKAKINGRRAELYRANVAFKGIILPAGENLVLLDYAPLGGSLFYLLVLGVNVGMFGYLAWLFVQRGWAKDDTDAKTV